MLLTDANFKCDIDVVVIEKRPLFLGTEMLNFSDLMITANHLGEKKVDQNTEIKKAA